MKTENQDLLKIDLARTKLYNASIDAFITLRQKIKTIENLGVIFGFDLIQIILLISKNSLSGYLNIIANDNNIYGINFSQGCIVQIDNRDASTFIGQILINDGYITEIELTTFLKNKNSLFGQELVSSKKMTAEQLQAILYKQAVLRLTQLINSNEIQVTFTNVEVEAHSVKIDQNALLPLAYDWVFTCLTDEWLEMHFYQYRSKKIHFNSDRIKNDYSLILSKLVDYTEKDFIPLFNSNTNIKKLEFEIQPKVLRRICFMLSILNCLQFENSTEAVDTNNVIKLIEKIKIDGIASDLFATSIKNEAKDLIYSQKHFEAFTVLKKLNESQLQSSKIELYAIWCLLGHAIKENIQIDPQVLKARINKIRPEDRYDAEYFYVMALFYKYSNNMTESETYYNKSCAMNPKFYDFKITRSRFADKLKSLIRFSVVCLGLSLVSKYTYAEILNSPIRFTNQYFNYAVAENNADVAGLKIDFKNFEKLTQDLEMTKIKNCYVKKNENTQLILCEPRENSTTLELKAYIANTEVDSSGSVILQDLKNFIEFTIKNKTQTVLSLKARRRPIAPFNVIKEINSETTQFTLLDLNHRRNMWVKELNINELKFKLESSEEPYDIFQEFIYTSNEDLKSIAIDFTMKLPTELKISSNRIGINALLGYSSFITSTATFNSVLNSNVGYGLKFLYEKNLDKNSSLYTNLILYSAQIANERNSIAIETKKFTLFDYDLGYKIFYNLNWAFSFEYNYRNNFSTFETMSGSGIFDISQSNSSSLGITPEYTFLESRLWNLIVNFSPALTLPQSTPYGNTQIGYSYGTELKTTYKLKESRVYAGINYTNKVFNSNDAKFQNKDFIYSVGFYYLY